MLLQYILEAKITYSAEECSILLLNLLEPWSNRIDGEDFSGKGCKYTENIV